VSALPSSEVLDTLDATSTIEKRASWEGFEFTILEGGKVEVVNKSYDAPEGVTYTVYVEGGIPFSCTCTAFDYQDGSCKHMVAVAIREPVLKAVSAVSTLKTDGGVTVEEAESDHSDQRPEDCDCTPLMEVLPCWPCYADALEAPHPIGGEK